MKQEHANTSLILVVEDEVNLRRLFVQFLLREKYSVHEADTGEMAKELIGQNNYDVIITDMQMRKLSGLDVLNAAKNRDPFTQVLIVTGFGSVATAVNAMQQGAYEYLTKPVQGEALVLKVRNALERRHLQQTLARQEKILDEHHLMIERDLGLARQVQASLVPEFFSTQKIDVGVKYIPMIGLGGDFADILEKRPGHVYFTVTDVTGHGIAAALVVNRVCSEWRKWAQEGLRPAQILCRLNAFFLRTFYDTPLFLTIMIIECDLNNGSIRFCGSAHPPALLWRHGLGRFQRLEAQNIIIGFEHKLESEFIEEELDVAKGDVLYLFTDGLCEAENQQGKPIGLDGLQRIIKRHTHAPVLQSASGILEDLLSFSHGAVEDDMLILVAAFC